MKDRIATLPVDPLMIKIKTTQNIINWLMVVCTGFGVFWLRTHSSYWLGATVFALGFLVAFFFSNVAMSESVKALLKQKLEWHGLSDIEFNDRGIFFATYRSRRVRGKLVPNDRGTLLEVLIEPLPE